MTIIVIIIIIIITKAPNGKGESLCDWGLVGECLPIGCCLSIGQCILYEGGQPTPAKGNQWVWPLTTEMFISIWLHNGNATLNVKGVVVVGGWLVNAW